MMLICKQCGQPKLGDEEKCVACDCGEFVPPHCCPAANCRKVVVPHGSEACPLCNGPVEFVSFRLWLDKFVKPALDKNLPGLLRDASGLLRQAEDIGLPRPEAEIQFEQAFAEHTGADRAVVAGWVRERVNPLKKRRNNTEEARLAALESARFSRPHAELLLNRLVPAPPKSESSASTPKGRGHAAQDSGRRRPAAAREGESPPAKSWAAKLRGGLVGLGGWLGGRGAAIRQRWWAKGAAALTAITAVTGIINFLYGPPVKPAYDCARNNPPILNKIKGPLQAWAGDDVILEAEYFEVDKEASGFDWRPLTEGALIIGNTARVILNTKSFEDLFESRLVKVSLSVSDKCVPSETRVYEVPLIPRCQPEREPEPINISPNNFIVKDSDKVRLEANVRAKDGEVLTYEWHSAKGHLDQDGGPVATLDTSGINSTTANMSLEVSVNVRNQFCKRPARMGVTITIQPRQSAPALASLGPTPAGIFNAAPVIVRWRLNKSYVRAGETVRLTAEARDADDVNLFYLWTVNDAQQFVGPQVTIPTPEAAPDSEPVDMKVTLVVSDSRGARSNPETFHITVAPPAPPAEAPQTTPTPLAQPSPSARPTPP